MIPLAGDWTGSGRAGVGYYDPAAGRFYLRRALSSGPAWRSFRFGPPRMVPLAGAWSAAPRAGRARRAGHVSRADGVGFYNPADGWFHLRDRAVRGPGHRRVQVRPRRHDPAGRPLGLNARTPPRPARRRPAAPGGDGWGRRES